MRTRAVAILIQNNAVALLERHRFGQHYFIFPGGGVDEGEIPEQAVVRETHEELGVHVRVIRLVAEVWFHGNRQLYFLVEQTGGEFGTGTGEEYGEYDPMKGTFQPVWMPIADLPANPVKPADICELVIRGHVRGWPEEPTLISEQTN